MKKPDATFATPSLRDGADSTIPEPRKQPHAKRSLTPRQKRAIDLLRPGQWVDRHLVDRIAGCAHAPGVIHQLRGLLGDDAIETRKVDRIDRDGKPCRPGQYRLAQHALPRLALLEAGYA